MAGQRSPAPDRPRLAGAWGSLGQWGAGRGLRRASWATIKSKPVSDTGDLFSQLKEKVDKTEGSRAEADKDAPPVRKPSLTDDDAPPLQDATAASAEQARYQCSGPHALTPPCSALRSRHTALHGLDETACTCTRPGARRGWQLLRA